jgi:RNA-directed DNA polymerase
MNYEKIVCDANNLYRAYKTSVKSSKWKETTQKFTMNFLRYIFEIQDDIVNRTLRNGPTQEFTLHERGRIRPITSIQIRDRIIRHVLCDDILLPEVRKHIIYDNCASIKGRGISQQRNRFEIHLHKYYKLYGNGGWILFGDFSKFYDNIVHEIAKKELLKLFDDDEFIEWILTLIFDRFKVDVSYMSDEEYENCYSDLFNKLEYRNIPSEKLIGEKWMAKSVNIGDQLSQVIGIYYPHRIDTYIKYVRQQKFYGRYMDDWYIMNPDKEELDDLLLRVTEIAKEYGIHINEKKTRIVRISSTYRFLQIKYALTSDGKIIKRIDPKKVTAMRRKLKRLSAKVTKCEIEYDNVENMFRSWMGAHYKLLLKKQRKNLIQLYEKLYNKKISIINRKLVIADNMLI